MDIYQFDDALREKGFSIIAGVDEAGRGPLAGPVVAAAVILKAGVKFIGLRDSKKVSQKRREELYDEILFSGADVGIGVIGPEEIDRLNILRATKIAMQLAIENLPKKPDILIIDSLSLSAVPIKQLSPVKAESKSASVAAASIIAKVVRDRIMLDYHAQFPNYNFGRHKGYSTKEHLEKLRLYGPSPIHRRSFFGVTNLPLPF